MILPVDHAADSRTVAFVPCLPPGLHPGMDALAHGLRHALASHGLGLRIHPCDLRASCIPRQQDRAVREAVAFGYAAVVLFVLDMAEPAAAVRDAVAAGVPVVAVHKPAYATSAAVVVPNFHHGVCLAQELSRRLFPGASVSVLGGPDILDDVEMVRGVVHGLHACRLRLLNDPFDPQYRNLSDVVGGGRAAVERLLDDHPYRHGMVVFNDETMRDALEVLAERRLLRRFPVVCRNGSAAIVDAVRRGDVTATLDYGLPEIGFAAGELVARCLAAPNHCSDDVPGPLGRLITRDTLAAYQPWSERVPHLDLAELLA